MNWIEFWDSFESAVHNQATPDVQKFNYLVTTLKGATYKAIEGISITNANYADSIEILKKWFGDSDTIKCHLYAELRIIPPSSLKISDLRRTLENIERICRQLTAIGEDHEQQTLIMLILEKLPHNILLEIGKLKNQGENWKIDNLRVQLHNIISIKEEAFQILQSTSSQSRSSEPRQQGRPIFNKQPFVRGSAETFVAKFAK